MPFLPGTGPRGFILLSSYHLWEVGNPKAQEGQKNQKLYQKDVPSKIKFKTATKLGMRARVGVKTGFMTTLSDRWVTKDCSILFCSILICSILFCNVLFCSLLFNFYIIFAPFTLFPRAGLLLYYSQNSADCRDKSTQSEGDTAGNYKNIFFVCRGGQPSPEGHSDNVPGCTCGAGGWCNEGPSSVIRADIWVLAVRASGSLFCSETDLLSLGKGKSLCDC